MNDNTKTEENKLETQTDEGRRKALKKLGTCAYVAPVMVSLLASKKATALSPPGTPPFP